LIRVEPLEWGFVGDGKFVNILKLDTAEKILTGMLLWQ